MRTDEEIIDSIYQITLNEQLTRLPRIEQIKRYIQLYKEANVDNDKTISA